MSNSRYGNLLDKVMKGSNGQDTSILEHIDRFGNTIEASRVAEKERREDVVRKREQKQELDTKKQKEQEKAEKYKTLEYYIGLDNPKMAEDYAKMIANKL